MVRSHDMANIAVREVHTAQDCRLLIDVFNRVWDTPAGEDVIDIGVLVALAYAGNYVAVVERDGEPVGGGVGFFGPAGRPFHSHIVGVLPAAAGQGVGRAVKLHQRAWCLDRGTTRMEWTYDPLVARNAAFNIRGLGAVPTEYHHDFYGPMDDGINRGQSTDRAVIEWNLEAPVPVAGSHAGSQVDSQAAADDPAIHHVAVTNIDDHPGTWTPAPAGHPGSVLVGVPHDIETLRRTDSQRAREWRHVTRTAFTSLLADGWIVRDFRPSRHYEFHRPMGS